nr:hypothetical protein [Candidatus Njordarchaeum guaymaensis]
MVRLTGQEHTDNRTTLKFKDFKSICPFTDAVDIATVELDYTMRQGQTPVDPDALQAYLASFKNTKIAMEMIPIEILRFCVNASLRKRPPTGWKHAAPDEVSVRYDLSEGKTWSLTASVNFSRDVK